MKLTDALSGKIDASQKLTSLLAVSAAVYSYFVYMSEAARESSFKFEEGIAKLEKMKEGLSDRLSEMREYLDQIKDVLREPTENAKYVISQMGINPINAPIFIQSKPTYHILMSRIREELKGMVIELSDIGAKLKRDTTDEMELNRWVEFENRLSNSMATRFANLHEIFNNLVIEQVEGPLSKFYERLSRGMEQSNENINQITKILTEMELDKNKIQSISRKEKSILLFNKIMVGRTIPTVMFLISISSFAALHFGYMNLFDYLHYFAIV